jgi:hypothetical protein
MSFSAKQLARTAWRRGQIAEDLQLQRRQLNQRFLCIIVFECDRIQKQGLEVRVASETKAPLVSFC